jgi:hypothetical protein
LLHLASDVRSAVNVVFEAMSERRPEYRDESALFSAALALHVGSASQTEDHMIMIRSWVRAQNIALFSRLVGIELDWPSGMNGSTRFSGYVLDALDEVREVRAGEEMDGDLFTGIIARLQAIREIRCDGDYARAIALADRDDRDFAGTGADCDRAEYQVELAVALLLDGRPDEVKVRLEASNFWDATQDYQYPSRHRYDYALALGEWATGNLDSATTLLTRSQRYLHRAGKHAAKYDVADLVLSLAQAEVRVTRGAETLAAVNAVSDHLESALGLAERIRGRWGVVSRSRSPLSVAFRRIYGDIARLAAATPGRQSAEHGLRAAVSAKQSGLASLIRIDRSIFEGRRLVRLIDDVVALEDTVANQSLVEEEKLRAPQRLERLRLQIVEHVSPMLADLVVPIPPKVGRLIDAVGNRYALDFVALPDTLSGATNWYRTLIGPGGMLVFELLEIGEALSEFLSMVGEPDTLLSAVFAKNLNWHSLATNLLPCQLRDRLQATADDRPIELVIAGHSGLSLMPWAALRLDDSRRLIHTAVITQIPVLTCLAGTAAPPVSGPALVHLVSGDHGVDVRFEQRAWSIASDGIGGVPPLSRCILDSTSAPVHLACTFVEALADMQDDVGFAHIASHGSGVGLGQTLHLPGAPISAARALTSSWPASVLMASCHVGRLFNIEDGEPFNFVMALLAGGSESVVACIDEVDDGKTGQIAAKIIRQVRRGSVRLEVALRNAQMSLANQAEETWALVSAYAR